MPRLKLQQEPTVGITPANARAVLLSDGWHPVEPGTFRTGYLDGLEIGRGEYPIWFSFTPDRHGSERVSGPVSSILAIREI